MLSVLIPTYNYEIRPLVESLHHQAVEQGLDFEIIVIEDGSTRCVEANATILELKGCRHIVLPRNVGRSAIRNRLADEAIYDNLLYLDCDARLHSEYFISKYIPFFGESTVVLGGRVYDPADQDPRYSLMREYGAARERNDLENLENRRKHPMFTTPNFLISKSVFLQVRFDEDIVGYGHEDTIFGIRLHELGIPFLFIDNPVIHVGLQDNEQFLQKTRNAIFNLYRLWQSNRFPLLAKESKLLSIFLKLKRFGVQPVFSLGYQLFNALMQKHLCGEHPSLFVFDLYKIFFLCKIAR